MSIAERNLKLTFVWFMQESVWQAGRLFLQHASSDNPALLPTTLEEEGFGNELLFGPIEDGAASDATPEAETWKVCFPGILRKPVSERVFRTYSCASRACKTRLISKSNPLHLCSLDSILNERILSVIRRYIWH